MKTEKILYPYHHYVYYNILDLNEKLCSEVERRMDLKSDLSSGATYTTTKLCDPDWVIYPAGLGFCNIKLKGLYQVKFFQVVYLTES